MNILKAQETVSAKERARVNREIRAYACIDIYFFHGG
jgi:hypothetical protein